MKRKATKRPGPSWKTPAAAPTAEPVCLVCRGKDQVIEALHAHIASLERQVDLMANLADPMVQARVAAARGDISAPMMATPRDMAEAIAKGQPNHPRRWREPEASAAKPKPDTPSPDLDPEGEFDAALAKAREADPETQAPNPA